MTSKRHAFDMRVKLAADAQGQAHRLRQRLHRGQRRLPFHRPRRDQPRPAHAVRAPTTSPTSTRAGAWSTPTTPGAARPAVRGRRRSTSPWSAPWTCWPRSSGIDPLEFRLRNSLAPGQSKSTGRVVQEWPFPELCEAMRPHYERAVKKRPRRDGQGEARRRPGHRRLRHRRARRHGDGGRGARPGRRRHRLRRRGRPRRGQRLHADPAHGASSWGSPMDKVRLVTRDTDQHGRERPGRRQPRHLHGRRRRCWTPSTS